MQLQLYPYRRWIFAHDVISANAAVINDPSQYWAFVTATKVAMRIKHSILSLEQLHYPERDFKLPLR
jgi:hypothetical protein